MGPAGTLVCNNFLISALVEPRKRREVLLYSSAARGWGKPGKQQRSTRIQSRRSTPPRTSFGWGGSDMSFQVVRHEHPNILVVNRQTYETYRLTVGEDGLLVQDGAGSDLREARRAAMAFIARSEKERGSR